MIYFQPLVSYFDFETSVAEVQLERTSIDTLSTFSDINNLAGVRFRDNCNIVVVVNNLNRHTQA